MKIKINENFKEKYLIFLQSLAKENNFEYYPVTEGYTKDGLNINLGFSCFALKSFHILDEWDNLSENKKHSWIQYINSFQKNTDSSFDEGSFIDYDYLTSIQKLSLIKEIKRNVKRVVKFNNKVKSKNTEIEEFIRAESKQAISTLYEVGATNEIKYKSKYFHENNLTTYLMSLDWTKPWTAGAQFSGLCVFLETQEKDMSRYSELKNEMTTFIENTIDQNTGSYFMYNTPESREIVNGAMKVITGLDWLDIPIHEPNKLIDTCLEVKLDGYGCDIVDIVYVLYMCSKNNTYRRKEIELYFNNVDEIIYKHYFFDDGGFSYFQNKSQLYYYGLNITSGLNKPDIHGSTLLLWALSLMTDFRKNSDIKINILKP
tara:strand:+ start:7739 stop:8857 length:1119 start_codon:yes stop_codon:yes gene_type:complete